MGDGYDVPYRCARWRRTHSERPRSGVEDWTRYGNALGTVSRVSGRRRWGVKPTPVSLSALYYIHSCTVPRRC